MNESRRRDEHIRADGKLPGTEGGQSRAPDSPGSAGGGEDPLRAAELRMIDALLRSMSQESRDARRARVGRVMEAIPADSGELDRRIRSRRWQSLFAVAACLTLACALSWLQFSSESRAADVLREIAGVSQERIDRVYELRRVVVPTSDQPHQPQGRLYLRGCEGFVIVCGDLVLGGNADEFWFVPKEGPVIVAQDFQWLTGRSQREKRELGLLNVLAVDSRSLPLVQLSSAVELMRKDYQVALDDELLHGQAVDLLVGKLRDEASGLPEIIRLWADKTSRIIKRAELEWRQPLQRSPADLLIFEFAAAEHLGADWYDHEAHHPSGRPLRRISSGS